MVRTMEYKAAVMDRRTRSLTSPIVLVVLTLVAHANTHQGDFQFDDIPAIQGNIHLTSWEAFAGHLGHMVRPVLYGTFLLDHALYGSEPAGYHLLNLLLHLGSGLLIYRILSQAAVESAASIPFWAALLFLIHPMTTETVTYISGRASGLMTFFYLLTILLYLKALEHQHARTVLRQYLAGAVVAFLLALGSKETAATLPLILLLWDLVIRRRRGALLRDEILSSHLPFWIVLLVAGGWAWYHPRYTDLAAFSLQLRPFWDNLLSQAHAAVYAVWLFFRPWKQNFDHDLPEFRSILQWPLPLDLLLLGGSAVIAVLVARRLPFVSFGIGWFLVQLLPTILIPRADLLSERNLYLASFGLMLTVAVLGSRLMQWLTTALPRLRMLRHGATVVAVALVLLLCLLTYQRNQLYHDRLSLWSDTVSKSPNKARPHNNLGHAYAMRGEWDRAIEEFRIAAQLDPDSVRAHHNLRKAYLHEVGRP